MENPMSCDWMGASPCSGPVRPYLVTGRYMNPRHNHNGTAIVRRYCTAHAREVARTPIREDLRFTGGSFWKPAEPLVWFLTVRAIPEPAAKGVQ